MLLRLLMPLLILGLSTAGCKSKKVTIDPATESSPQTEATTDHERRMDQFVFLKKCMTGNFNSHDQNQNDKDFFDIRVRMVPIWKSSDNVFYMYVEQAMAATLNKPFNQQVYKAVRVDDSHTTIFVYSIPDAERFVGKQEGDYMFESFDQEVIVEKVGCELMLEFNKEQSSFSGGTKEKSCVSETAGIAWTSSDMIIKEDMMEIWNRSWDANGKQAKGPTKGAYIFKKEE